MSLETQRTLTLLLPDDADIRCTRLSFQQVQQDLSAPCYNAGQPLGALSLQRQCYHQVKGTLNAQMTISAIRLTAGAYASAQRSGKPAKRPFAFRRARALFLIGKRGRDADFRADGTLSLWTVAGRKRVSYTIPDYFQPLFAEALELDSLTIVERNGKLIGRLTITLDVPEPAAIHPVGIDLNETNALVAVDPDGRTLFISGKAVKVKNRRTYKTRNRLKRKLAARKAERKSTRSVRRTLKRLGRQQSNRTKTFAQQTAKTLVTWAPKSAVLVFEDLHIPQPQKGAIKGKSVRRLSEWQHGAIRRAVESKAQLAGLAIVEVNPAYTSKICSRCGLRGKRKRHTFTCPSCGFTEHADVNAALNIRNRFTADRGSWADVKQP
ncbi:MAG: IS200/IS605 family element transposase accessory protein TnpB [Ktedonobacteraceae bacterium]|nr:IS200/IS605 family element transposase accessory protein TnpB [Ktedonobacteraceae bacterium]